VRLWSLEEAFHGSLPFVEVRVAFFGHRGELPIFFFLRLVPLIRGVDGRKLVGAVILLVRLCSSKEFSRFELLLYLSFPLSLIAILLLLVRFFSVVVNLR